MAKGGKKGNTGKSVGMGKRAKGNSRSKQAGDRYK